MCGLAPHPIIMYIRWGSRRRSGYRSAPTRPPARQHLPWLTNFCNEDGLHPMAAIPNRPATPWRGDSAPSLPEVHGSIAVSQSRNSWRRYLAYIGPGFLIAVGYMDPGNWATDLAGGAQFGYLLLSVILISNLMAILLQALAARLGIVTGRDLAQACHDSYPPALNRFLWVGSEIAIAACDLAEVIGSAVALKLLFGLPLLVGVLLTGADVLLILVFMGRGFRYIEALVVSLI